MITRREFGQIALAGLALPRFVRAAGSEFNGVRLGAQSYSFRDLPRTPGGDAVDQVIKAFRECELVECEFFAAQVEPQFSSGARGRRGDPPSADVVKAREDLRKWRLETPLDHFRDVGEKFRKAGIEIYAYNYSPNRDYTDAEIDRGFEMTKALGAQIITASTTIETARRIAPLAEKHKMVVAMHGHSNTSDPNEFCTPDSFAAAMKMSKYFKVNLDIGHFTAANFDAVAYIKEHHKDITNIHLKDRKKNQGDNMPWGQGETPIREVLQLLKKERWPIRAYIEYEYRGQGTSVEEVKKCFAYAKAALA
ncbi:MAG TPA: TIM barrel protein [Vicinamibacterales bacterium]|jgi:sugar phosphate isomerase/epimerase|nr:TIM barrel protein [Vicinamibacterales bacterium]